MSETTTTPIAHPPGDYAIVELFGHQTLVGRITEIERFGTKMLVLEPLFDDQMLPPAYHGGASIYRLTPCTAATAYELQPRRLYQLPASIRATVPTPLLTSAGMPGEYDDIDDESSYLSDADEDEL